MGLIGSAQAPLGKSFGKFMDGGELFNIALYMQMLREPHRLSLHARQTKVHRPRCRPTSLGASKRCGKQSI